MATAELHSSLQKFVTFARSLKGDEKSEAQLFLDHFRQWCEDAAGAEESATPYRFVYVDQDSFEEHRPESFASLATSFTEYQS